MNSRRRILLSLYLLVLLGLSAGLVSCNQAAPPTKADAVTTWIKLHAIPFNTTTPDAPEQDLHPLKQIVGNASIVGLGEATHGTHEFFEMKHRVLEFLVKQMGFTTYRGAHRH